MKILAWGKRVKNYIAITFSARVSMRIDCVFAAQKIFPWKFAFCAWAENVIATISQPGGRSESSAQAETHHAIRPLLYVETIFIYQITVAQTSEKKVEAQIIWNGDNREKWLVLEVNFFFSN